MSDISVGMLSSTPDNGYTSASLQNLDKDTFLQLLVAQMRYQNPMSPVDSNEYLAQAAQYASVEQLENMAQSQAELRSMQMVTIATGLVGQEVTAVDPFSDQEMTGVVDVVKFGAEPLLVVNGVEVPLSSVLSVREGVEEPSTSRPPETVPIQPEVIEPEVIDVVDPEPDPQIAV